MSKVLVIYWSMTGNTEAMANALVQGAKDAGAEVTLSAVGSADASLIGEYENIAFGCPSMGDEVLDEDEMEPFFTAAEKQLSGKKVALFGSYDWGDGEWMRNWEERTKAAGATLCDGKGLIINLTPDDAGIEQCKKLGSDLAAM